MGRPAKQLIKDHAPTYVFFVAKVVYQYGLRMSDWVRVLRDLRGCSLTDALKLYISLVLGPLTALKGLSRWGYPILLFDVNVRTKDRSEFQCAALTDQLFLATPSAQKSVRVAIQKHLQSGDTFIDIGANIGFFSVLASKIVGPGGRVFSVEMVPQTAEILRYHLKKNDCQNATVFELALTSSASGTAVAHVPRKSAGQATLTSALAERLDYVDIEVSTATLDQICADLEQIDLIKIDVEGHEYAVLQSGMKSLARSKAILFETWGDPQVDSNVAVFLEQNGFILHELDQHNRLAQRKDTDITFHSSRLVGLPDRQSN